MTEKKNLGGSIFKHLTFEMKDPCHSHNTAVHFVSRHFEIKSFLVSSPSFRGTTFLRAYTHVNRQPL